MSRPTSHILVHDNPNSRTSQNKYTYFTNTCTWQSQYIMSITIYLTTKVFAP